jgi:hypothetical protein
MGNIHQLRSLLTKILALAVLTSCSSVRDTGPPKDISPYLKLTPLPRATGSVDLKLVARANRESTRYFTEQESLYYAPPSQSWPTGLPQVCLTFSGGGLRSAATAVGVLQALAQLQGHGDLPQTDIVSAVSGGAYALFWLNAEGLNHGLSLSETLIGNPTQQATGQDTAQIAKLDGASTLASTWLGRQFEYLGSAGIYLMERPFRFLRTHDDQFHMLGGVGTYYGDMLQEAFNSSDYTLFGRYVTLIDLAKKLNRQDNAKGIRYPYPIFGSAVRVNTSDPCSGTSENEEQQVGIPWRYFEMAPDRIGSYVTGYRSPQKDRVETLIVASGAAPDRPAFKSCRWMRLFGVLSGAQNGGFLAENGKGENSINPSMFMEPPPVATRGQKPMNMVLSDGGFADNLAAFPAASRLCKNIVILDAGHDPYLLFQDLRQLENNLATHNGIALDMPRAIQVARTNADLSQYKKPADELDIPWSHAFESIIERIECRKRNSACRYADELSTPVFSGNLTSVDRHLPGIPYQIQDSTENQSFEKGRFKAYRELGRHLVLDNWPAIKASMATAQVIEVPVKQ